MRVRKIICKLILALATRERDSITKYYSIILAGTKLHLNAIHPNNTLVIATVSEIIYIRGFRYARLKCTNNAAKFVDGIISFATLKDIIGDRQITNKEVNGSIYIKELI